METVHREMVGTIDQTNIIIDIVTLSEPSLKTITKPVMILKLLVTEILKVEVPG